MMRDVFCVFFLRNIRFSAIYRNSAINEFIIVVIISY